MQEAETCILTSDLPGEAYQVGQVIQHPGSAVLHASVAEPGGCEITGVAADQPARIRQTGCTLRANFIA